MLTPYAISYYHTITNTHFLRMVIANCEVEYIVRAKNSSVTWKDWTRFSKEILMLLLTECWLKCSCQSPWMTRFRLRKPYRSRSHQRTEIRRDGSGLSRMPWTKTGKGNCRHAGWRPNLYHQIKWVSLLVAVPNDLPLPPAYCCKWPSQKTREVLHLFILWFTHTHAHTMSAGQKKQSGCPSISMDT